ncbi:MAG: hypothetical protein AAF576_01685 [Pseudomonadota bacterium]
MLKSKLKTLTLILTLGTATSVAAELFDTDAAWNLLNTATVSERLKDGRWEAVKRFPDPLRDAAESFVVEGFVIPILPEPELSTFMMVQDPNNCPFCGTGSGYAPVLEVMLSHAIPSVPEFSRMRVTGELELIDDPDTYQMFRLVSARPLD